ncbi:MAG TPA: nuclear transport factor 2 family protein, partial [Anaerolineales bacterium]|nr:nuclear transport factor 2 family protein [Anaerolineales bacterium]
MDDPEKEITKVLDAYKSAVYAKDVDAFVSLYDRDVRIFDLWGAWSYSGIQAWRKMVTDWFGSLGAERVVVETSDVKIAATDKLATLSAFIVYKGVSAEGGELRSMQNRL